MGNGVSRDFLLEIPFAAIGLKTVFYQLDKVIMK
jgi:hypothetical protein